MKIVNIHFVLVNVYDMIILKRGLEAVLDVHWKWECRVKRDIIDPRHRIITVDRTSSLDAIKEMLILRTINLPKNVASIPEYYDHMQSLTRVYNEASGEYRWVGDNPDHFFHAENYALIAQRLMIMLMGRGK